jgi:hypothetical protein
MVDIWFKAMAEVYFESLKVPSCYWEWVQLSW